MATVVKMPQLGESVVEGTVARWLKAPGDSIARLEPLLEISTDKIDTEVPAPAGGVLLEIVAPEGSTVPAGAVLAYIGAPGDASPRTGASDDGAAGADRVSPPPVGDARPAHAQTAPTRPVGRSFISPVVARMAAEHNVDLAQVPGTGLNGRITKKDVLAFLAGPELEKAAAPTPAALAEPVGSREDEIIHPLSAMRRAIAEHMARSKRTSPHVTTICEVDMRAVVRHREAQRAAFAATGINLTYTAYFVAAAVAGLRAVPLLNSRLEDVGVVESRRIHINLAVALENGLITPVLRDADEQNLQGLARAVNRVTAAARSGHLAPDDLQGGTFTITNHGTGGSLMATPILNQPQAGILGVGAIVKRPVVRSAAPTLLPSADDAIVIRPICYLSLTFDHRILDGAQADAFLRVVRESLENWKDETVFGREHE